MVRSVDKCRRTLRKRAHVRSLCCTCSVILGIIFLVFRLFTYNSSSEEKEYNILLSKLKKVKGIGKSTLLYVDKSEYIFADEQPDNSEIRNIIAKQAFLVKGNKSLTFTDSNRTGHVRYGTDNQLAYEHDPTIDENAVPESFKWHINVQRTSTCTPTNPAKHVVLLRSHRTGSHTIGNIFYRYGDFNNLFFALPKASDFQQYWPLRFHHTRVDKSLLGKDPPNFLINTARNSRIKIKSFISSETYKIAIMRDPVFHFQSIYESVDMPYLMKQVTNSSEHFREFVRDPNLNLEKIKNVTKMFDPVFYLLHNGQLFDFGYNIEDYMNEIDLQFVIQELDEYLDLVLITEYMDESLVLLQRMLCWQLSDVVYIKKRVRRKQVVITEQEKEEIREWNKHDSLLYNHFNTSLWEKIAQQDEQFWKDVKKLKETNINLHAECIDKTNNGTKTKEDLEYFQDSIPLHISYAKINGTTNEEKLISKIPVQSSFEVLHVMKDDIDPSIKHICERLLLSEKEYIHFIKLKQKGILQQKDNEITAKMFFRNTTEGQFYYDFLNSISNNKTKINTPEESNNEEAEEIITLGLSHTD